ncbi:MAG: FeoA family protein [Candidatus Zixiibacteriota bacterium]
MTLLNANLGQTVSVVGLTAEGLVRRRLLDLGFTPGARVDVLHRSPMGDPVAYRVRGATIALRGVDANQVLVREK